MTGVGTDFHAACITADHRKVPCETWFGLKRVPIDYAAIRHEVDVRFGYYWNQGNRFEDVIDTRPVRAMKILGMYHYNVSPSMQVGAGLGLMPFYGSGFDSFTIPIVTPLSVRVAPLPRSVLGGTLKGVWVRFEESYLAGRLTGSRFGNSVSGYNVPNGEWNGSIAIGYDFRLVR